MNTTTLNQYVRSLNCRTFTKNVQRVLYKLLTTEGGWISRGSLRVNTAFVRDLRKDQYGAFDVICENSVTLGRTGTPTTFYRLNTNALTMSQLRRVFES